MALGLDFGTESVRALLVGLDGAELASAVEPYQHGQITGVLRRTREPLPPGFALQDPRDWTKASAAAVAAVLKKASRRRQTVVSIGVAFTSCTLLPTLSDGTPLCLTDRFRQEKHAWPKLWKHHAAKKQAHRITEVARQRGEKWLDRYGGVISEEWFFPKVLETLENAPTVYDSAAVWLDAGDWYVWRLVGGPSEIIPRSTCQAGYKAIWSARDGYPSSAFFATLDPRLERVVADKIPGRLIRPGQPAGGLAKTSARELGLPQGIPVSAAMIDAHAGVLGCGATDASTLVMVMGTSGCYLVNAPSENLIAGIVGTVEDGILPGYFGYETGQAALGDAFNWFRRLLGAKDFGHLERAAATVRPGSDGVLCLDWFNGCRAPLMNGTPSAVFHGLTLSTTKGHLYRAMLEGAAFGMRWIADLLRHGGVPCDRFIATGGLAHRSPLLMQICADALGKPILVHPSRQGPALGAAALGALAAGKAVTGFASLEDAVQAMAAPIHGVPWREAKPVSPGFEAKKRYDEAYQRYRALVGKLGEDSQHEHAGAARSARPWPPPHDIISHTQV